MASASQSWRGAWNVLGAATVLIGAVWPTPCADRASPSPARPDAPAAHGIVAERPSPGRRARKPFDPIRDNGPIFVDWPTPKLAIVVTGRQDGYLEPCGCAGLDRMRGGLGRRQTMIESLRAKGWPLLLVDAGGIARRWGLQEMLKFRLSVEAMSEMGYDAIGLGAAELRFPAAELLTLAVGEGGRPGRFLSANVGLFGVPGQIVPEKRVFPVGDVKVGVTSILGATYRREIHNPDLELGDPQEALASLVGEMRRGCDLMILLAHATQAESVALARWFPQFDVVVTADGPPIPPAQPKRIEAGKRLLVEVGEKVKDVVVLGWFDRPEKRLRYQRVPLDSRFAPSAGMAARMAGYQDQLRQLGLEGLGLRPVPHPQRPSGGDFVGSEKCGACHEAEYGAWKKSGHARATQALAKLAPPRSHDPECLACHVTGWHPQGRFPYQGGYLPMPGTGKLAGVGCESCHGPGGRHAAAESGTDEARREAGRAPMRLHQVEAQRRMCVRCHDADNSPDFAFDAYWPDVAHAPQE